MIEKTNKLLIILVSVLIVLVLIAVIMFSMVINKNNKQETETQASKKQDNVDIAKIDKVDNKEENEVLVAILGEENSDSSVVVIGADGNYNEKVDNVVENNLTPYYIKVNVQTNSVTIYKKDGNGNYNIPLKAMTCSCGGATPIEGTYSLKKYNNWEWKTLYGGEYGRYATQITGDFLFSSVPYKEKGNNQTLNYEEYDKLGTFSTVGNIQLTVADAKWIYDNCEAGTQVTFYTSEVASPLNVAQARVITEDEEVRGWDPTDPDENNPWKTYVRPVKKEEPVEEKKDNEQNTNTTQKNETNTSTNLTTDTNTTPNTNTNVTNNVNPNNNTLTNTVIEENSNTIDNNVDTNTLQNTTESNTVQNNEIQHNTVVENRVLEKNNQVTITSEVIDRNNI